MTPKFTRDFQLTLLRIPCLVLRWGYTYGAITHSGISLSRDLRFPPHEIRRGPTTPHLLHFSEEFGLDSAVFDRLYSRHLF